MLGCYGIWFSLTQVGWTPTPRKGRPQRALSRWREGCKGLGSVFRVSCIWQLSQRNRTTPRAPDMPPGLSCCAWLAPFPEQTPPVSAFRLVRRQGSQVSMRVARGSASWLSSHGSPAMTVVGLFLCDDLMGSRVCPCDEHRCFFTTDDLTYRPLPL